MASKIDMKKYSKMTEEELTSIVQIVARGFIGNTLVFYFVSFNKSVGYIFCNDFDEICKSHGVTIQDKSNIKRVGFSTPANFNMDGFLAGQCQKMMFQPTETSKQDAQVFFQNGIFVYDRTVAKAFIRNINNALRLFCNNKYADKIQREQVGMQKESASKFMNELSTSKFIEIFDTSLGEVIGYCKVDNPIKQPMTHGIRYIPAVKLSKADVDSLGVSLNIVGRHNSSYKLIPQTARDTVTLMAIYEHYVSPNNLTYNITFPIGGNGVTSVIPGGFASQLNVTNIEPLKSTDRAELAQRAEQLRLAGNRYLHNNGRSFLNRENRVNSNPSPQKVAKTEPKGAFGMLASAFKESMQ